MAGSAGGCGGGCGLDFCAQLEAQITKTATAKTMTNPRNLIFPFLLTSSAAHAGGEPNVT